jgi:polysaccharide biosynthesis transport protein
VSVSGRLESARESEGLHSTLRMMRRHWRLVVGVCAASLLVGVISHETAKKSYAATASVTFQEGTLSESVLQVGSSNNAEPQRQAATEALVAHSSEVAHRVATELHSSLTPAQLLGMVKVEVAPNADVLEVTATTHDPQSAARIANAFAKQYIAFKTESQLAGVESAESSLKEQIAALPATSAEKVTLQQSLQRLSELRAVAGGGASVIGSATPPSEPTGTRLSTTILFSLIIGLAIAFAIVFLLESLDRRLKSIEELEREYRLPVLTAIPQFGVVLQNAVGRGDALEPYRILRSALDLAAERRPLGTLLVTSAVSGEGKTTVAVDLAHTFALTGRDVVLIELDLRRPSFASHFKVSGKRGFTTLLASEEPVSNFFLKPFPSLDNLSVLPAGQLPPNPSELLGSERVSEIITDLSREHDLVIIDAPPLNPVADAQVLLDSSAIQAVLMVARADRVTREQVQRARSILDFHQVEPVGLAAIGLEDASRYGYEPYEVAIEQADPEPPMSGRSSEGSSRGTADVSRSPLMN